MLDSSSILADSAGNDSRNQQDPSLLSVVQPESRLHLNNLICPNPGGKLREHMMKDTMKLRQARVRNTLLAFATPIHQRVYDNLGEFNAELARRILALRERSPGEMRSNVGGWHSDTLLLQNLGEPYTSQLPRMMVDSVKAVMDDVIETADPFTAKLSIDAWAIVNERGHFNTSHIHPDCVWSGVYYVATEPNAGGEIEFTEPRTQALMIKSPLSPFQSNGRIALAPQPGMMLVFPSFLYHAVGRYEGTSPRISIAFNLQ
jgi:uncharacterized protein (TIGR02466 family)